jgi:nitrite reductase (NADH) small subunit/3-phenylpropionate/trans-cinnamate dioxygenase ferredoxin subunit
MTTPTQPVQGFSGMPEFQTVARLTELADGQAKTVTVGDKLIALFRVGNEVFALDDVCPHMGASLSEGEVANGIVTCSWHGWRFRLADGAWADSPRVKTGCYPVRIVDEEIQVLVETKK